MEATGENLSASTQQSVLVGARSFFCSLPYFTARNVEKLTFRLF
jgi:hypothetical protein